MGGPPLPGQYELLIVNNLIKEKEFSQGYNALMAIKNRFQKIIRT